jgi:hypothetical protein
LYLVFRKKQEQYNENYPALDILLDFDRIIQEYVLSFPSADHDCGAIISGLIWVDDLIL